jgi:hypothetical protein
MTSKCYVPCSYAKDTQVCWTSRLRTPAFASLLSRSMLHASVPFNGRCFRKYLYISDKRLVFLGLRANFVLISKFYSTLHVIKFFSQKQSSYCTVTLTIILKFLLRFYQISHFRFCHFLPTPPLIENYT